MTEIKEKDLQTLAKKYAQNEKAHVVRNALTSNDISTISNVFDAQAANPRYFSIDLAKLPVTNQMQSGRCWIFSSMNVLREMIAKKYKIDGQFELSQNFIAFYDKLEKANWFMECVTKEIDQPFDDRTMQWLLDTGVGDGGQWNMIVSIIKKYGLCPKSAMPETYQSSHTHTMNGILNKRLRRFAIEAKKAHEDGRDKEIAVLRKDALQQVYGLLCDCFGVPPKSFTFEYYDTKKVYHAHRDVTPLAFYEKFLGINLDDYVVIINAPTADKPYGGIYSVQYIGNVVGGEEIRYLNLPMDDFKKAVLNQMKDGECVWFGCDCGKDINRDFGLWDDAAFDYENTFDMDLSMTKAEMLDSRQSAMNHAMVLTGVNLNGSKPERWKIENSWGDTHADKGFYTASDSWFDLYVYEAAVNKKYLSVAQRKLLKKKAVVLAPWDPFGTLAD